MTTSNNDSNNQNNEKRKHYEGYINLNLIIEYVFEETWTLKILIKYFPKPSYINGR